MTPRITYLPPGTAMGVPLQITAQFHNASRYTQWNELQAWANLKYNPLKEVARAKLVGAMQELNGSRSGLREGSPKLAVQNAAFVFFFNQPTALRWWCEQAEISVKQITKTAEKVLAEGLNWRAAPGEGEEYALRKAYRDKQKEKANAP